jgi:hypothetical protein
VLGGGFWQMTAFMGVLLGWDQELGRLMRVLAVGFYLRLGREEKKAC